MDVLLAVNLQEHYMYNQKCNLLLQIPELRFAGFLDSMGNLIAGGFKQGVTPLHDESERQKLYMETVLRVRTREEFDYDLGEVQYAAARRKKVVTMTFPLNGKVLFVSMELNVNIEDAAEKIMKICWI
jgi:hypothetical protein